jgi:hypothetical protein
MFLLFVAALYFYIGFISQREIPREDITFVIYKMLIILLGFQD